MFGASLNLQNPVPYFNARLAEDSQARHSEFPFARSRMTVPEEKSVSCALHLKNCSTATSHGHSNTFYYSRIHSSCRNNAFKTQVISSKNDAYSAKLSVGFAVEQGLREEMEDVVSIEENETAGLTYVAVFDGHAGSFVSKYLKENLYRECFRELQASHFSALDNDQGLEVKEGLCRAFLRLDEILSLELVDKDDQESKYSGSTATAVFISNNHIAVANVGDTRAVICSAGTAEDLCNDHRPYGDNVTSKSEVQRINAAGGWVAKGRVCGYLAVSRAFGDILYKNERQIFIAEGLQKGKWTKGFAQKRRYDEEWVIALPEVSIRKIAPEDEFLVVASDGLWDFVKSSEAVRFIRNGFEKGDSVQKICRDLASFAHIDRKGDDNISIALVKLR